MFAGTVSAQTLYFSTNVPANWSATIGSLAISTNHYKAPANLPPQCLQWNYGANDILTVADPGISAADVTDYYKHTCDLWVYNPAPLPGKKLTFQFVSSNGTAQYYFDFYLDYSGWRRAVRSYKYDMDGPASSANFTRVRIVGPADAAGQLFFDAVTWVGPRFTRNQDLPNIDISGYLSSSNYCHVYNELTPDIPTNTPTASELNDLATIRTAWLNDNAGSAPSSSSVQSAYASWSNLNIVVSGTDISGEVISDNTDADLYYSWLLTIAKDIYWRNTAESSNKMSLFLRNWWDQGMDANSGAATAGGSVSYSFRTVPSAFVLGYKGCDASAKQHAWQMLHWMFRMGHYWSTNWVPGMTAGGLDDPQLGGTGTDDIYLNTRRELGAILFLTPDDATAIQYLKGYRRYIERFLTPANGTDDGLKVDGCGFHHAGHYNGYLYAFNELSDVLYDQKGTQFQVSSNAYLNFRGAFLAEIRMVNSPDTAASKVGFSANSLNGRHPFSNGVTPTYSTLQRLGVWGGAVLGQSADPVVARVYNRLFGTSQPYSTFTPYGSEPNPEGFYQFNYSPIGIYRQTNWVACMHGMNNDFWGTEIFRAENVYGRYQSYGSLEILYPGGYAASGWSLTGWDWNKPPGATTIVLPWIKLAADSAGTYSEHDYSALNFAGGLAFHSGGNNLQTEISGGFGGLYACNFQETGGTNHNSSFAWRKSWFCFTNQIICLGSNITNNDAVNPTVTTLFQSQLTNTAVGTAMNGTNVTAFPTSRTNNDASADWLLDGQGAGYFVRPGSPLRLDRAAQVSPDETGSGALTTNNYATAWIDHGTAPASGSYEYVVAPNTTSNAMSQLAADYTNSVTTPYTVLECDATAHVVQWKPDGRIGYALFSTNALASTVTNAGPIRSVSLPCLAMSQPTNGSLWLTVVNPDLNLVNNISTPTDLLVTLAGIWSIASGPANASVLTTTANTTTLRLQAVNGLPVETLLAASGRITPVLTAPTASAIVYGQTLASSTLTGGAATNAYNGAAVAGSFAFTTPGLAPDVGTTNAGVTFTPVDTNDYASATTTVSVTVLPVMTGGTFQWDANPANSGAQDGSGTWGAAAPNWLYNTNNVGWSDHNVAAFGVNTTTNCLVMLTNDVTPSGITFNAAGGGSYTIAGTNAVWTTDGLNIIANGNGTLSAILAGAGGLTNRGAGSLTLAASNTYTGTTVAGPGGTLNIQGSQPAATGSILIGTTSASATVVNIQAGAVVVVAEGNQIRVGNTAASGTANQTLNVSGAVTNYGTLYDGRPGIVNVSAGGVWLQKGATSLNAQGGYSSCMTINAGGVFNYAGTASIGINAASGSSGSARLTIAGGTFVTSKGFQNSSPVSTGVAAVVLTNGGTLALSADIPQLITGPVANTYLVAGGGTIDTFTYSTTISNGITGSGGLTKLGAGSLTLAASNSYSGGTAISNGTLLVNGAIGTGPVTVASDATLGGTGIVGGAVTLSGTLAPGGSALGTLRTGAQIWKEGGAYRFGVSDATNSSGWDALSINGTLNVQSTANKPFVLRLVSLTSSNTPGLLDGFSDSGTYVWTLATATDGVQNFDPAKLVVDTTSFSNFFTGTFDVGTNANSLLLTYAARVQPPVLTRPVLVGGNTVVFTFFGPPGQSYRVVSATNLALPLSTWLPVTNGIFGTEPVRYFQSTTHDVQHYFRVGSP